MRKENIDTYIRLSRAEGKIIVWKVSNMKWQQQWDQEEKGRHLYAIQNRVGTARSGGGNRKEETVITRLRIGHTNLNSTLYIIGKHLTGLCERCQELETIEHVLISCRRYIPERRAMIEGMRKSGLTGDRLKDLLECGGSGQGRRCLISFLITTALMDRI